MKKRIFSRALALFMALSLLSTTAFAASFTQLQEAIDGTNTEIEYYGREEGQTTGGIGAWTDGDTRKVELYEQVTRAADEGGITITEGQNVALDLNGQKVVDEQNKLNTDDKSSIKVAGSESVLTVSDSGNGGTIESNKQSAIRSEGGTVNFEGGTIEGDALGGIFGLNGAVVNVTGGTVTGTDRGLGLQSGSKGTISGEDTVVSGDTKYGVYASDGETELIVEGGTVTGWKYGIYAYNGADVTVSGGAVTGTSDTGVFANKQGSEIEVSGGSVTGGNRGIELQSGATGIISGEDTTVTGGEIGVAAFHEGTELKVEGGTVTGGERGLNLQTGAKGTISGEDTTVTGDSLYGVYAAGEGTELKVEGGTVTGGERGLSLGNGAKATVSGEDTLVQSETAAGIYATGIGTEVNIEGGMVKAGATSKSGEYWGLGLSNGAIATISGGTIISEGGHGIIMPHDWDKLETAPATCVVTGGEIIGGEEGLYVGILHVFEMTGGTISGPRLGLRNSPTISIKGGSIVLNDVYVRVPSIFDDSKISVTGGTVGTSLKDYVADGYVAIDNGDESWTVVRHDAENDIHYFGVDAFTPGESYPCLVPDCDAIHTEPAAPVTPGSANVPPVSAAGVGEFAPAGTTGTTAIADSEVPLAGLITRAQLVSYLYEHEGSPDGEDAEGEYTLAMAWAVANGIVDEEDDPEEIVTVAILKDVMNKYAEYLDTTFDVVIEDEDDMIVMNCGEILAEFYASLEDLAA